MAQKPKVIDRRHKVVGFGNVEKKQLEDMLDQYWEEGWILVCETSAGYVFRRAHGEEQHGGLGWVGEKK